MDNVLSCKLVPVLDFWSFSTSFSRDSEGWNFKKDAFLKIKVRRKLSAINAELKE